MLNDVDIANKITLSTVELMLESPFIFISIAYGPTMLTGANAWPAIPRKFFALTEMLRIIFGARVLEGSVKEVLPREPWIDAFKEGQSQLISNYYSRSAKCTLQEVDFLCFPWSPR